jgi:hypothetical protein
MRGTPLRAETLTRRSAQEEVMRNRLRFGAMALAFVSGIGVAAADPPGTEGSAQSGSASPPSQLKLSPAQRMVILNAVLRNSAKIAAPTNFQAAVGQPVPPSIELYVLPSDAQSPELRGLKYTMFQNQVVLIDPTTMRVVDVIRQ